MILPKPIRDLTEHLQKLPGIGPKTASRLALFYAITPPKVAEDVATVLRNLHKQIVTCQTCFNISDQDPCFLCEDDLRNKNQLCIIEAPLDIIAMEQSGVYKGKYFVLSCLISPIKGIGAEDIRITELISKIQQLIKQQKDLELIFALNPSLEGETTIMYIQQILANKSLLTQCKSTRLAMGLPTGADIDYADEMTLRRAFEGRDNI